MSGAGMNVRLAVTRAPSCPLQLCFAAAGGRGQGLRSRRPGSPS